MNFFPIFSILVGLNKICHHCHHLV